MLFEDNAIAATNIANEMSATGHLTIFSVGFNLQTGELKLISTCVVKPDGIKAIMNELSTVNGETFKRVEIQKQN